MNNPYGYYGYAAAIHMTSSRRHQQIPRNRRGGAGRGVVAAGRGHHQDVTTPTLSPNPSTVQPLGSTGDMGSAKRGGRGAANSNRGNRGFRGNRGNAGRGQGNTVVSQPRENPTVDPETNVVAEIEEKRLALNVAIDNFNAATFMERNRRQQQQVFQFVQPLPAPVVRKKLTPKEILKKQMEDDEAELVAVREEAIRMLTSLKEEETKPKKPNALPSREMEKEHIENEIRQLKEKLWNLTGGESSKESTSKREQPQKTSQSERKLSKIELEYLRSEEEAKLEIEATSAQFEKLMNEQNKGKLNDGEGPFSRKADDKGRQTKTRNDSPAVDAKKCDEDGEEIIEYYSCPADTQCCNVGRTYKMTDYDFFKNKKEASRLDWPGLLLVDRSPPVSSRDLSTFLVREKESIFNKIDPIGKQLIEHVDLFHVLCGNRKDHQVGDDPAVTVTFKEYLPQLCLRTTPHQNSQLRPILIDGCGVARSYSPNFSPTRHIPHQNDVYADDLLLPMFPIISVAVRMLLMGHKISIVLPSYYKTPYIKKEYRLKVDDYYSFNKLDEVGLLTFLDTVEGKKKLEEAVTTGACVVGSDDGDDEGNTKHPLVYVDFPNKMSDMIIYGSPHKFLSKNMREGHRNVTYQIIDESMIMRYAEADDCSAQTRRQSQLLMKQQVFLALHLCGLFHQPKNHSYGLMMLLRLAKMQGILVNQIDRFITDNPLYPLPTEEMVETILSLPEPDDTTEGELRLMSEAKKRIELKARGREDLLISFDSD